MGLQEVAKLQSRRAAGSDSQCSGSIAYTIAVLLLHCGRAAPLVAVAARPQPPTSLSGLIRPSCVRGFWARRHQRISRFRRIS